MFWYKYYIIVVSSYLPSTDGVLQLCFSGQDCDCIYRILIKYGALGVNTNTTVLKFTIKVLTEGPTSTIVSAM